jgi:hypothetical protein
MAQNNNNYLAPDMANLINNLLIVANDMNDIVAQNAVAMIRTNYAQSTLSRDQIVRILHIALENALKSNDYNAILDEYVREHQYD